MVCPKCGGEGCGYCISRPPISASAAEMRAWLEKAIPELRTGMVEAKHVDAFIDFHVENPHVYDMLVRLALRAKRKGSCPGIGCLFEVMRYRFTLVTTGNEFKLNNNFRSLYARVMSVREPELRNYFEFRDLRSIQ